ncbi:MAG: hypothetical protein LBU17_01695 [Treponema sp.]|jgi:hypothetical protein|nr:hypothetical protein [Treponema sp.]
MISINFLEQQDRIINYIKEHYQEHIPQEYPPPNNYTSEFLDSDKFKNSFIVFFDFGGYTFNWKTNESELQEIELTVYLLVRNDTPEKLREKMLHYATAFYQMFDASVQCFDGAADYGKISGITFYDCVEGSNGIKIAEITIILRSEI